MTIEQRLAAQQSVDLSNTGQTEEAPYVQGQTETMNPVTRANGPQAPCDSDGTTIGNQNCGTQQH